MMACNFMGFLNFKKKEKFLNLSEKYKQQQEKVSPSEEILQDNSSQELESQGVLGFLGNMVNQSQTNEGSADSSEEKRQRLSKRLKEMTSKMEELSNQIYHLQQRIELLERKMGTGSY